MSRDDDIAVYLSRESLREMQENMNTMKKEILIRVSISYDKDPHELMERYLPEKMRKIPGNRLKTDSTPINIHVSAEDVSARISPARSVSPPPAPKKVTTIRRKTTIEEDPSES